MAIIIAISGKKRSGKDTVADYLCQKYNFVKQCFADPLKQAVAILFDWKLEDLYNENKDLKDDFWKIIRRKPLQTFGTELMRQNLQKYVPELGWVKDNFWVLRWMKEYDRKNPERVVIPDARFINEIELIRLKYPDEFFSIRINRNIQSNDIHLSEISLDQYDKFDFIIDNNSTFEHLFQQVDNIMEQILKGGKNETN